MTKEELAGIIKRYVAKQVSEIKPEPVDTDAIVASFERRFSDLQLSWERQARDTFEKALDRMPIPQNGKDALPIEDVEIKQDGRNVTIKLGEVERTIKL